MTESVRNFEHKLETFTGAPYVVTTDCCTHAIELCFRLLQIKTCRFSAHTYISVPMTMKLLGVDYEFSMTPWRDEYQFLGTPVWDSARCLKPNMYRRGQYQCLSFGHTKPLDNVRGGAILLDNEEHYKQLKSMSYDGRDSSYSKMKDQKVFNEMKKLGGNRKLTIWAGDNHGVSGKMILGADNGTTQCSSDRCDKESDFMTWLFSQSR